MKKKVVLIANSLWNINNYRSNLIHALKNAGYDVAIFAPRDRAQGNPASDFFHIPVSPTSMNPIGEILLVVRLLKLLYRKKPDIVLNFTIKPVIYGTISARILGIPVVNNITGLGAMFLKGAASRSIGFLLYNIVMRITTVAFFQNPDDFRLFERLGLLRRTKADLLPGSGVDLMRFSPCTEKPQKNAGSIFLFVGRLLREKGIEDYIDAARCVKARCNHIQFHAIGPFGSTSNEPAIRSKIMQATEDGTIKYLGKAEDVRPHISKADCVVLPSFYREGTPRSLLEAASMGKPIITTDMPGCREVVEEGKNGYLCKVRDSQNLAGKMIQFMELPTRERLQMGRYSRHRMEKQFDERIVIKKYQYAIKDILKGTRSQ